MASSAPLKSRHVWLIIAAGSVALATFSSFTVYLNSRVAGRVNWNEVILTAVLWLVFGALTRIPYSLARRFPLRREHIVRTTAVHLAGAAALSLSWTIVGFLLSLALGRRSPATPLLRLYLSTLLSNLSFCVLLYFAVLGCIYAFFYYGEVREREAQQARLAAQLAEAKLSALRMQLKPHFLFNSLNAITVLVRDQNFQDASRMLELLSGILRQVLQSNDQKEVTLDDELGFTERYLAIEQVRFSDRLKVKWSIEPAIRDAIVPEFILQPLVENAIRHGAGKRSESGLIEIAAAASNGDLLLSIRDNGPGYDVESESGVGLANTRARLETLFGDAAQLDVGSADGAGTVATVRLPLRRRVDG